MNMQKYASYKEAAKRIVRLLNEEREMKKEAEDVSGQKPGIGTTLRHPWKYRDAEVVNPETNKVERRSIPVQQLMVSPETRKVKWYNPLTWIGTMESKDPVVPDGTPYNPEAYVPPYSPSIFPWMKNYAMERNRLERERANVLNKRLTGE